MGGVRSCYDKALAETIIGLYETGVIHHCGPWRTIETVEYATLQQIDGFNLRRLLDPNGSIAHYTRNVKRGRSGQMKLHCHRDMKQLISALDKRIAADQPAELKAAQHHP